MSETLLPGSTRSPWQAGRMSLAYERSTHEPSHFGSHFVATIRTMMCDRAPGLTHADGQVRGIHSYLCNAWIGHDVATTAAVAALYTYATCVLLTVARAGRDRSFRGRSSRKLRIDREKCDSRSSNLSGVGACLQVRRRQEKESALGVSAAEVKQILSCQIYARGRGTVTCG